MDNINNESKDIAVRVAIRIRPLVEKELREGCQNCLETSFDSPQVGVIGTDKAFTFDYVFSSSSSQESIYLKSVSKMVEKLFKGYNVTILAYGQTGSGKTYSMGTVCSDIYNNEAGVIPRSVKDIFSEINERYEEDIFVKVSFIELYKERVYDLLNTGCREENVVDIREDPKGGIKMVGLTEIPVTTLEETMQCLQHGALNRATGATAMNLRSSRSHAIFSLHIEIGKKNERDNIITSKFHLVDLAGSERAKKTGATGERFKEGVNINKGLLALGNVISSLCGEGSKSHIPYRDSKLTRLLQDSLGGNSHTLMLACVSPADSNLEETLSTLRYADRARKIKNKPTINRDPQAAELAHLRQQVQQLQVQLLASQSGGGGGENVPVGTNTEIGALINQIHTLEDENEKLTKALQTALDENTNMAEKALMAEMGRDQMKTRLEELRAQTGNTVDVLNKTFDVTSNPQFTEQINLVKDLQRKIIDLQSEQSKREKAIVEHELSRHTISTNTEPVKFEDDDDGETVNEDDDTSPMKGEFGATFTLRQAKLNEELTDLNKALAMKEQLMSKLTTNDTQYVMMKSSYEKNLKELEQQINSLIKEKEELNQKLRSASTQNASNKIAEQRRKRLMELENLISGLKKKIGEQNKLLRLKEQSEQKVVKLNSEIQNMKSVRVKLIRQMKEDGEKFRQWKAQKDREVAKLKEEDRKKQFQIVKMERLHSKQQNVLKRKMEEAVAINKRLKDAMALQKSCQEKRNNTKDIGNANSRLKYWLNGELEVVLAKSQAQKSLQTLIEDRKTISTRLNQAKRQLNKEELSETLEEQLRNRINVMEKDLQLRTAQISDLQSKIVDDDAEVANKKRFDSIQTMVESKLAMQHLFQVASEKQVLAASHESDLQELNNHYEEVCQNLEEAEKAIKEMKSEHQKEMDQLSREHEDKILFLLRQLPQTKTESDGSTDNDENDELLQRLKFQEEELARLSHLHDLLVQKTQECEDLKRNLEIERQKSFDVEKDHVMATPPAILVPRTPIMKKEGKKTSEKSVSIGAVEERREPDDFSTEESEEDEEEEEEENSETEGSDDEFEEDKQKDPDWRKTPLFKRIRQMTSRGRSLRVEPSSLENEDFSGGVKRTSEGKTRCKCSKSCSSKLCSCKKAGGACNVDCKCNALVCVNRVTPNNTLGSSMEGSKCDTLLNSTFDVCSSQSSEPLTESSYNKKAKLSNKELKKIDATTVDPLKIEELDFSMPPL